VRSHRTHDSRFPWEKELVVQRLEIWVIAVRIGLRWMYLVRCVGVRTLFEREGGCIFEAGKSEGLAENSLRGAENERGFLLCAHFPAWAPPYAP